MCALYPVCTRPRSTPGLHQAVFCPCSLIKQTDPLATASDGGLLARMRVLASPCPQRTQYRARRACVGTIGRWAARTRRPPARVRMGASLACTRAPCCHAPLSRHSVTPASPTPSPTTYSAYTLLHSFLSVRLPLPLSCLAVYSPRPPSARPGDVSRCALPKNQCRRLVRLAMALNPRSLYHDLSP